MSDRRPSRWLFPAHAFDACGVWRLIKFLLAGFPAFLLALPLNFFLVKWLAFPKPGAYALVLVAQTTANFFMCRFFVFEVSASGNLWKSFTVFLHGILLFRLVDWALYSALTTQFHVPFLGVQLFNVGLFALLKFEFCRRCVFERKTGNELKKPETDCDTAVSGKSQL